MAATVAPVAYLGPEARAVEVQVQLSSGLPKFTVVGVVDKAVAESRERVRAALASIGLAFLPKLITVNLSPADLAKEGSLSAAEQVGRIHVSEALSYRRRAP